MPQGDSGRDIAASRVMGRPKAAQLLHIARTHCGRFGRGRTNMVPD